MRKTISILLVLLYNIFYCYPDNHPYADFGIYGIQKCKTLSDYQKYIGKKVIYLPQRTPSKYDKESFQGEFNKEYIIQSIKGNDRKMIFTLQNQTDKKNIKMSIYNQEEIHSNKKYEYCITEHCSVPLFLIDDFNKDKSKYIGKVFKNDLVITEYECVDVQMKYKEDTSYPTPHLVLKNNITGVLSAFPTGWAEVLCFEKDISGAYETILSGVEKPANENIRYGETKVIKDEGVTKYRYNDDYIDILIYADNQKFNFSLKNISSNTLKLIWNEAVFIDSSGKSSKVMHVGTKYSQKDAEQPASVIIKNASLDDTVVPTTNVRYSDTLKDWVIDPMYPRETRGSINSKEATRPMYSVKLMLPIQIKDITNEYIFTFNIKWVYNHPELLKKEKILRNEQGIFFIRK